jgi:hypothetical protein
MSFSRQPNKIITPVPIKKIITPIVSQILPTINCQKRKLHDIARMQDHAGKRSMSFSLRLLVDLAQENGTSPAKALFVSTGNGMEWLGTAWNRSSWEAIHAYVGMSVRLSPPWFETRSISAFPTQFRSGINP